VVNDEQNGGSKQVATHRALREKYVKCYNVTRCTGKSGSGLAGKAGDENGSHMTMALDFP
uniref:hypothetical protein n=1 Tax=Stenotrophomonas maltophilia group sp. Smal35 TaxID=3377163 RepID=UPI002556302C